MELSEIKPLSILTKKQAQELLDKVRFTHMIRQERITDNMASVMLVNMKDINRKGDIFRGIPVFFIIEGYIGKNLMTPKSFTTIP